MAQINAILDEMERLREQYADEAEGKRIEYRREWNLYTNED